MNGIQRLLDFALTLPRGMHDQCTHQRPVPRGMHDPCTHQRPVSIIIILIHGSFSHFTQKCKLLVWQGVSAQLLDISALLPYLFAVCVSRQMNTYSTATPICIDISTLSDIEIFLSDLN